MNKNCIICGVLQPKSEYYTHKQMPDGTQNKCKTCCKKQAKEREERLRLDPIWVEKEKERAREKYGRLNYKEIHKPSSEKKKLVMDKYTCKYPEKKRASSASQYIKKIDKSNEFHHWSYNDIHFKDIIELTTQQHGFIHRYMIYDQEQKMYRTTEGVLLDTKESHLAYYEEMKKIKPLL